jgi:hypothetical protein
MPERYSRVLERKKTIFLYRYRMSLFTIMFVGELGMCPQNFISGKGVDHREKNVFLQGGMLKFTYKGTFLRIKMAYEKLLFQKSKK